MASNIKVSSRKTSVMVKAALSGRMAESTRVAGSVVNRAELATI